METAVSNLSFWGFSLNFFGEMFSDKKRLDAMHPAFKNILTLLRLYHFRRRRCPHCQHSQDLQIIVPLPRTTLRLLAG